MAATTSRTVVNKTCLLAKFRGALVGAVIGDCLGAAFEGYDVKTEALIDYFSNLEKQKGDK